MSENRSPAALITFKDLQGREVRVPLYPPKITIGKSADNDLSLSKDQAASRRHCRIDVTTEGLVLTDLGSSNGTFIDGRRIDEPTPLAGGSMVLVGRTRLFIMPIEEQEPEYATLIVQDRTEKGSILIPPTARFEALTKAYLVVDLVRSTDLLSEHGESYVTRIVSTLRLVIERTLWREKEPFLQCTGDGFFAAFSSADAALDAVSDILAHHESLYPPEVRLCAALHWGPANFSPLEGLIGRHIHAVFSIEGLRGKHPTVRSILEEPGVQTLVLLSTEFRNELSLERSARTHRLGAFELKGFSEPVDVYRWE